MLQLVDGATDAVRASIEHMGVEVGGKGMAEAVGGGRFIESCLAPRQDSRHRP